MRELHLEVIALDKDSGGHYGENFLIKTKEDFETQFKEFKEKVPFFRWYYEIVTDEILTDEEEALINELEEMF